ncbi:extracellular solute-binding protein [Picosynechococcus sp. PCC 73109]|uniref:extracellular solute-binding protein n=1 Tax=Picosynechococcus sp. PCC 73109 TaxID=374982 RepID=UPI00074588AF|nr:extracellular solute-binding protein [Picosynechococcus sp. PCC 73109]AMA08138.1 ABC transporter substrate-binding protein [Picosynechococcus sp. PCC 73109]
MPNRRHFLTISALYALAGCLGGCQRTSETTLQINTLRGSISPQLLTLFRQNQGQTVSLDLKPLEQLQELFEVLQDAAMKMPETSENFLNRSAAVPDLLTLGHGWYQQAIALGFVQPLSLEELTRWEELGEPWQRFLRRNVQGEIDPQGQLWGQPYRWGTTMLVYRKDKLKNMGWTPTDWADLWQPELQGKISLLNQSREVLGLLLKKQGKSYNETDPEAIANLESDFQTLHRQVKFYSSTHYLQPLNMGDTWIAQGWSQDILPLLQRYRNLGAVIPASGTALWCDLWVQPQRSQTSFETLKTWLDFCWEPAAIQQISRSSHGASPLIYAATNLDPAITDNPLIYLDQNTFRASEIIEMLNPEVTAQYQQVWQAVRQG